MSPSVLTGRAIGGGGYVFQRQRTWNGVLDAEQNRRRRVAGSLDTVIDARG